MRFREIYEARRNAHLPVQKRKPIIDQVNEYADQGRHFLTFTELPKAGINPNSNFSTPIGVYCYPLFASYYWQDDYFNGFSHVSDFPFAAGRRFIYILKESTGERLFDVDDYSRQDWDRDRKQLSDMYRLTELQIERMLDEYEIDDWSSHRHRPISRLWRFTRYQATKSNRMGVHWNNSLRFLGYSGFSDLNGLGVIHENEPAQAFFLTKRSYEVVEQIENRRSEIASIYYDKMKQMPDSAKKIIKIINATNLSNAKKAAMIKDNKSGYYKLNQEHKQTMPDGLLKEIIKYRLPVNVELSMSSFKELIDEGLWYANYINNPTPEQIQYYINSIPSYDYESLAMNYIQRAFSDPKIVWPERLYPLVFRSRDYAVITRIIGKDVFTSKWVNRLMDVIRVSDLVYILKNGLVDPIDVSVESMRYNIVNIPYLGRNAFNDMILKFFEQWKSNFESNFGWASEDPDTKELIAQLDKHIDSMKKYL